MGSEGASRPEAAPFGLWGRAFRPFFLLVAIHTTLAVPLWVAIWLGALPPVGWLQPTLWHGHEMVFGLVAGAIAGFLLTSAAVWSGGPAWCGAPLAAGVALWMGGRLAFALPGVPAWVIAAVDLAFVPVVAFVLMRTLRSSGQRRNQALVTIPVALAAANAAMHAEALGFVAGVAGRALRFSVDVVVVLLLVIGGRITPSFTRNALRRAGEEHAIRSRPWLDAALVASAGSLAVLGLLAGRSHATGLLAITAGLAAAVRLSGWASWHTRSDPLLWSLHAGAAWLVAGLLLVGASDLGTAVPASAGLHALTAGAMGATILAVMTRVGLGHTGRALRLPPGALWCHVLVNFAALLRVAAPFTPPSATRCLLLTSGLAWAAGFGLFVSVYGPILTAPRVDGRPG